MEPDFDDYCKAHIKGPDVYCKKVNMDCPPAFCQFVCWGDWKRHRKEDAEELRKKYRMKITDEERNNKDLVSVIITYMPQDEQYLGRTIESIKETAVGPLEFIVKPDGIDGNRGQRKLINQAASEARGKYLFRLDSHCKMSEEWDARMKSCCDNKVLLTTVFDDLDPETWEGIGKDVAFVRITPRMEAKFVRGWKAIEDREVLEETMGISGTSFMILKDYYWQLGGCDESLGEYGGIGTEWACKVWLTGGRCLICTDVVCYHLFRKLTPYDVPEGEKEAAYEKLKKQWLVGEDPRITRPFGWLVMKFNKYIKRRFPNYI